MTDTALKPIRPDEARAQAAEFLSVFAGQDFTLSDGTTWHLPNPNYMPRDMRRRYNEHLRFITHDLDKAEVVDAVTGRVREQTAWPLQYDGALIDEDELLCIALMGDDVEADREAYFKDGTLPETYEKFLDADGVAGQVQVHWRVMSVQMEERIKRDPFRR